MKQPRGISLQILRIVLVAFIVSFLFITAFHSLQYKRNTSNLITQSNEHSMKQLNESFNTFYQQLIYTIVQLSSNSTLKAYLKDTPKDNFEYYQMQRYVNDFLQSYTGFFSYSNVNLILYGKNNCTYSTYNETIYLEKTGILQEDFIEKIENNHKTMAMDFYHKGITPFTEDNFYTFAACSLFDSHIQSIYGYAVVVIDESAFSSLFSDLEQKNSRFSILTEDGLILSDSNSKSIGTQDNKLLKIAKDGAYTKPVSYEDEKYLPVSLQNPFFGFWLIQLTDYSSISKNVWSSIFLSVLIGGLIYISVSLFLIVTINKITGPIKKLTSIMQNVDWKTASPAIALADCHGCIEAVQLGHSFNHMLNHLHIYIENLYQEQSARRLAELNALQNQINPHFIYNTLTSFKYLCTAGRIQEVLQGITSFIVLLRKTIGDTRETISLKEEAELLESYFLIQKLRYGNGIRLMLQIPEECGIYQVPKMFLQPLVENSIFHGFSDNIPCGDISIYATLIHNTLQIEVIDNGQGMEPAMADRLLYENSPYQKRGLTGIGLKNVNERIKLIYGNAYGLHISSMKGYGTQIVIRLPMVCENGGESYESEFNKDFNH
ncbi:MAG: histidine kinase [Blautia sp.]|jgi:two-component system sensor histidine kinase YesM